MDANKSAYMKQKAKAKFRSIPWEFTFDEWLSVWLNSGRLNERGRCAGKYVMARHGDVGPYSPSNVEIILCEKNASDSRLNHPKTLFESRAKQVGTGRGWTVAHGKYQVVVSGKYIGRFATVEEAEQRYAEASKKSLMDAVLMQSNSGRNPDSPAHIRND